MMSSLLFILEIVISDFSIKRNTLNTSERKRIGINDFVSGNKLRILLSVEAMNKLGRIHLKVRLQFLHFKKKKICHLHLSVSHGRHKNRWN